MRHGISRAGYEAMYAPAKDYPIHTEAAVVELRSRGYDIRVPGLRYLLKSQQVAGPAGEERNFQWGPEDIDRVADWLEDAKQFVPTAMANYAEYLDGDQVAQAEAKFCAENPLTPRLMAVKTIFPGLPGLGIPGRVELRKMTPEEEAELAKAAEAARRAGKGDF
ncbi:MAG: hypothetical protein IT441_02535 [Phycisphaeraceae bacterium]|nr:hypothetical protein [Phycisphaeraceae bacterium]